MSEYINNDNKVSIGLAEALSLTLEHVQPLSGESVDLSAAVSRILAEAVTALVDSPSIHASLKDGYAVVSQDICNASEQNPIRLQQREQLAAGEQRDVSVTSGNAVRVLTGAKLPAGADAVVAEEFVRSEPGGITVMADAEPGRNILPQGSDVEKGSVIGEKGDRISPGLLGLIAAAGHSQVHVVRNPDVAIIATGDEVVAPGQPLVEGKLYASNLTSLSAWCSRYGFSTRLAIVPDRFDEILQSLSEAVTTSDAIITSGGAWTGDRDLVAKVLEKLGWHQLFHRIRIGPGKAVGFGILQEKPVFILPGGPPSNLMGFLQIALPGLLTLGGDNQTSLPRLVVKIDRDLTSRFARWTQFIYGDLVYSSDQHYPLFVPMLEKSRLRSMAQAKAIVTIPEKETCISKDSIVSAQYLDF